MRLPHCLFTGLLFWLLAAGVDAQSRNPYADSANLSMQKHDFNNALLLYTKAIAFDPQDEQNYMKCGILHLMFSRPKEALTDYNNAQTVLENKKATTTNAVYDGLLGNILTEKGQAFAGMGDNDNALLYFSSAINLRKNDFNAYTLRAQLRFKQLKYNQAFDDLNAAIIGGNYPPAFIMRARVYNALGRTGEAAIDLKKVLTLTRSNYAGMTELGSALLKMGNYDEAEKYLREARALMPNYNPPLKWLGIIKYWQGDYAGADTIFAKEIAVLPRVADGYNYHGLVNYKTGKYDLAMKDFNAAIAATPTEAFAYFCIARLKIATGNYQEAISILPRSFALDSTDKIRAYNALGFAYFKVQNYAKAIAFYDTARTKGGNRYDPYFQYRDEAVQALKGKAPNTFTRLEWISPVEDVNYLYQSTMVTSNPQLTVRIKIYSTSPIVKEQVKLVFNDEIVTGLNHTNVKGTGSSKLNENTREYEFEYRAQVALSPGKSTITVNYDNKNVQDLVVNYVAK